MSSGGIGVENFVLGEDGDASVRGRLDGKGEAGYAAADDEKVGSHGVLLWGYRVFGN